MIRESKIVRINNNTDCRRRVEYLHKAYNVLIDPEREEKRRKPVNRSGVSELHHWLSLPRH